MRSVSKARLILVGVPLVVVLSGAPGFAQAPAGPQAQAQQAAAPQPPPPFPEGARIALVNLQQIAQLSNEGKAATAKVQALISTKQAEAAAKAKQLQDNQTKLQQGGGLLNEAARIQLEREIERQTIDQQRFEQDAQAEIGELQTELQGEFQEKLFPILDAMVKEKGLYVLLSAADAGVILANPAIDLTLEAIKRFDAATAAGASAPASKP